MNVVKVKLDTKFEDELYWMMYRNEILYFSKNKDEIDIIYQGLKFGI